ncbi:MAG: Nucleoside 2-deoxyribosyltransferase [Candidatus Saccharibacteria bacterium]|nr:Nucleoside 2-deoxyribosyltransferase [Candidatus Saccharibacteria bacterium]
MSSYQAIVTAIKEAGGAVLSEIFVNDAILYGGSPLPVDEIYARDIAMINQADIVIAEVTNPSLGVGYELAYAENLHKPILCLFNSAARSMLSAMIAGNAYFTTVDYQPSDIPVTTITQFINKR